MVAGRVDEKELPVLAWCAVDMVGDVFAATTTTTSGFQSAVGTKIRRMGLGSRKKSSGAGPRGCERKRENEPVGGRVCVCGRASKDSSCIGAWTAATRWLGAFDGSKQATSWQSTSEAMLGCSVGWAKRRGVGSDGAGWE